MVALSALHIITPADVFNCNYSFSIPYYWNIQPTCCGHYGADGYSTSTYPTHPLPGTHFTSGYEEANLVLTPCSRALSPTTTLVMLET